MKKRDVNQMSIREIINEFGLGINNDELFSVISDVNEFFRRGHYVGEKVNVEDFLLENEDIIDKEKLMFFEIVDIETNVVSYKNLAESSMNQMSGIGNNLYARSQKESDKHLRKLKDAYALMKDSKVEIPISQYREDGKVEIEGFYLLHDILVKKRAKLKESNRQNKKNSRIFDEMEKQGLAEMIMTLIDNEDLPQFLCQYKANGEVFNYVIQQRIQQELAKQENINKSQEDKQSITIDEKINTMLELVKKFPEKFDVDSMLLIVAYRAKKMLEIDNKIKEDVDAHQLCTEVMEFAQEHIENRKTKIDGTIFENAMQGEVQVNYKFKNLEEDVSRIVNGIYFSKEDLIQMRQELFSGELEFGASSREFIELLNLTKEEKGDIVKANPNNLEAFVMQGMLDKTEVKNILENMEEGSELPNRVLDCLCCDELVENRDFVDLYMRKQINLKQVCRLHDFYNLQSQVTVDELMQYYENRGQTEEQEIDFEKYALLFREIRLKNSEEEEKQQIAEQIMEKLYETERDYDADLKNLYGANLLPIRTLIDWNGEKMIYDLIEDASIKPKDAKELLMTGELDVPKAYQALKGSELSDAEKLNFIFSSFDGVGNTPEEIKAQNEARMYLIQAMDISKDFVDYSETKTSHVARQKSETKQKANRYVSDPVYRWQLFSKIDENCDSKPFADGSVVFILPNVGNGMAVVEKLFKSTQKGTQINYGSATYCMSEEEYLNYKDEIEREEKINRRALVQMHKDEKASRAVHSKAWGKDLKKMLGLSAENGYTPEKMAEIDSLIQQIENSKELVR